MIKVICKKKGCFNEGVEIEVQKSHVVCGCCGSILNELTADEIAELETEMTKKQAERDAVLAKLGLTADEIAILLG